MAHHVGVPLVAKALSCPSRRADSLEDRLRHEVRLGRVRIISGLGAFFEYPTKRAGDRMGLRETDTIG